ncbi:MAG: type II toxin-antitoxin system HicA family toxin [Acidimicrobiales bacterium]
MGDFRSMKWRELQRVLERAPLNYRVERQRGSHRIMVAEGRPKLVIAGHESGSVPAGLVRKILVKDVGMSEDEAKGLL